MRGPYGGRGPWEYLDGFLGSGRFYGILDQGVFLDHSVDVLAAYEIEHGQHPVPIQGEFQEACGFPEFYAQMTLAWELIRAFSFSDANTKIELRVVDVQVTGDTGVVRTDWFFDGLSSNEHLAKQFEGAEVTPVEESNKQEWVFVDGQWRERTESNWDPSQGCPKAEIQQ